MENLLISLSTLLTDSEPLHCGWRLMSPLSYTICEGSTMLLPWLCLVLLGVLLLLMWWSGRLLPVIGNRSLGLWAIARKQVVSCNWPQKYIYKSCFELTNRQKYSLSRAWIQSYMKMYWSWNMTRNWFPEVSGRNQWINVWFSVRACFFDYY